MSATAKPDLPRGENPGAKILQRQQQRLRRYWRTAGWLIADVIRVLGLRIGVLLGLSMAGVAARVATFGGFIAYVHGKTSAAETGGKWLSYMPPVSDTFLWVLFIFTAGLTMGILGYLETRYRLTQGVNYSLSAMRRALEILSTRGSELEYLWTRSPRYMTRIVAGDSGVLVRTIMPIVGAIQPLVQLVTAAAILVVMSWQMALVLLGFSICYLLPYMHLSRRVIRIARQIEDNQAAPGVPLAVDNLVRRLRYPQFGGQLARDGIDRLLASEPFKERLRMTLVMRTNTSIIQLVNSAFISLFIVSFLMAIDWFEPELATVQLLAYAAVLIHAYNSANQLTSLLAAFNRFFPRFDRVVEVLRHPEWRGGQTMQRIRMQPGDVILTAGGAGSLPEGVARTTLKPGRVYLVLQPQQASVVNLSQWLQNLRVKRDMDPESRFVVPPPRDLPEAAIADLLLGGRERNPESMAKLGPLLSCTWMVRWLGTLPQGLDTLWSSTAPLPGPAVRLALCAAPALQGWGRIMIVQSEMWLPVSNEARSDILNCFSGACWLVSSNRPGQVADLAAEQVIVATRAGIVGIGSSQWLADRLATNRNLFAGEPEEELRAGVIEDPEELL